jgi:hypothetical protein
MVNVRILINCYFNIPNVALKFTVYLITDISYSVTMKIVSLCGILEGLCLFMHPQVNFVVHIAFYINS